MIFNILIMLSIVVCMVIPLMTVYGFQDKSHRGLTEAPDLVSVGNFRPGPNSSQGTPTTAVDFTFDQSAYLNGGDRSNFHLVPLNGGDALDGSTNVYPENDKEGDKVVTVLFPGDICPEDYARGYVDTNVVNSNCCNANDKYPFNINQSEPVSNNGRTENPDLVSVTRDGDSYVFEFDEPLTQDDIIQNTSGLRIYFPDARQGAYIPNASSSRVEEVDKKTLRAFYEGTIPAGYTLGDAVGAYVVQGTVQAARGSRGGNDGKNAFDEMALNNSGNSCQ